jgi:hypothetical protein
MEIAGHVENSQGRVFLPRQPRAVGEGAAGVFRQVRRHQNSI